VQPGAGPRPDARAGPAALPAEAVAALADRAGSGKIIGWAMDDNYKTPLITEAVKMAAQNTRLPEGAVFHSDRGSNDTSAEFAAELEKLGIRQSVGRTGICYDNALAESVNGTLKMELVHRTA
jgi:putative transposase